MENKENSYLYAILYCVTASGPFIREIKILINWKMNNAEIVITKNCPPKPNIFLVKEKRILLIEREISKYF